ncbi:MAG TPA: hypothetical protein VGG07_06725 [Solirubrobacteraceae bacterium]
MITSARLLEDLALRIPKTDDPVFAAQLVAPGYTGVLPRYGDALWPLAPLNQNPSSGGKTVQWGSFPAGLREQFRPIAWTMVNGTLSHTFLQKHAATWTPRTSPELIYKTTWWWAKFALWLERRGVSDIAGLSAQVMEDFVAHQAQRGLARASAHEALTALTRLWAFDQASAVPLGIEEPGWEREGVDDFLPAAGPGGENTTEPISPETMGPLLIWAMRVVDDFATDILAAWAERQRIRATAKANTATPAGLEALKAYVSSRMAAGEPIPASLGPFRHEVSASYIAALTGASLSQVNKCGHVMGWTAYVQHHPGPSPLQVVPRGTVDAWVWQASIDFDEAAVLRRHLGTACYIVCAYLTGMRSSEVTALRSGCCPDPDGGGRHLIRGRVFKTARDEDGNHLTEGAMREVPWVAITPVVNAIRVLEHMVPDGDLLFDARCHNLPNQRQNNGGALSKTSLWHRIDDFTAWTNTLATRLERPGEVIPEDPHGGVGLGRFRRTLAWHIARRPGGLVALAIQYGHLRTAVSASYAQHSRDGIHDLLDVETARATIDTVTQLHADLQDGAGISGPAARRAINAATQAPRFAGTAITARQARKLLTNPDLAVYENPESMLMCVYKADKALCHRSIATETPSLDRCVSTCANIARTDAHADQLDLRARELEKNAEHVPQLLAERLRAHADELRTLAERHRRDRTTPKEIH